MVTTPDAVAQRDSELPPEAPDTLGTALALIHARLDASDLNFGHGTDNAWDEAVELALAAMDQPPGVGDEVLHSPVSVVQWDRIRRWSAQRIVERIPLPYLTGRAWFAGLPFICDARALVPRSPLAEVILNDYRPWLSAASPLRVLDLCAGGGSIGIAAAVHRPDASVWLTDVDEDALTLARQNIEYHGVAPRVRVCRGDLFQALEGERFDVILSNPPYVDSQDLASMPAEYHAEPARGLGSGPDGLLMARRILVEAADHLRPNGLLFLELGNSWEALDNILRDLPITWLEFQSGGHGVLVAASHELPAIAAVLAEQQDYG